MDNTTHTSDTETKTTHYNLIKPGYEDYYNIDKFNENADIIDTTLYEKENTTNKSTSITSTSTDEEYPSAKAVYDLFNSIIDGDEVSY